MKRKSVLCFLAALLAAAVLPFSALAEAEQMPSQLEGYVVELVEDGFLMVDQTMGNVICNTDDSTVLEGSIAEEGVQVGDYVLVDHSGRFTRSIPPQTYAERVSCFVLEGEVVEIIDETTIAVDHEEMGEVWVQVAEMPSVLVPGMFVTVYYDGAMTTSLPAQIGARELVFLEMTGAVVDMTENGFLLQIDDENQVEITVDGLTHFCDLSAAEITVVAEPEEAGAEKEAAEPADEELAEGEDTAAPEINRAAEYLAVSDVVTVYYRNMAEVMPVSAVKVVILH